MKFLRQFIAHCQEIGAIDAKGDPAPQQHHVADHRRRRRTLARHRRKPRLDLGQMRRRQMMEQRDMRVEMIALWRKMQLAKPVNAD